VLRAVIFGAMLPAGGRGGTLYRVKNLNAKWPGSLAEAVSEQNRIVVFGISGTVDQDGGNIAIRQPDIAIAGQTAPG
jgi:lysophospholipase L1-like esterase